MQENLTQLGEKIMSEDYVRFKTNIEWYNASNIIYLTTLECFKGFLVKINEDKTVAEHVISEEFAKEINATIKERLDGEPKEIRNFSFDGEEPRTVYNVPLPKGTVSACIASSLEHMIARWQTIQEDPLSDDDEAQWFDTASKIVPLLWD
jgi:hypothetical protein